MFILEEPYVSNLLLQTLEKNQFEILKNSIVDKYLNEYKLNVIDDNILKLNINLSDFKIYSNSENSIDNLFSNYPNSEQVRIINLCKDKFLFRKNIQVFYPEFFFQKISFENLESFDISSFPEEFIIKPTVGFLSMGVHKLTSHAQWKNVVKTIKNEVTCFEKFFPKDVLSSSSFIVEEIIKGDEFAVDAYYNQDGKPVILNIFKHPFVSSDDVSDRVYISSKQIIEDNLLLFTDLLLKIGKIFDIKNFPIHIEIIKKNNNEIIPVEINPMRFAGWCTTDLAYFAYGINIYEYFAQNLEPDWHKILNGKDGKIFYFAIAETPQNIDKTNIHFDYEKLKENFSNILEFRKINYIEKPVFAIIFGQAKDFSEILKILKMDINTFILK